MKPKTSIVFYKSLFDNMLDGLAYCQMIFDEQENPIDFVFVKINKNFEELTGLKEVIGEKVTNIIPGIKKSNPELFEIYGRVSLTGNPEKFETYVEPLARWFFISVYCPKKSFFVAIFQNITNQKQIEKDFENASKAAQNVLEDLQIEKEALAHAKAKDEALLESIGEGLIAVDNNKKIIVANKMAADMLGWKMKDLIGKEITTLPLENEAGIPIPLNERPTVTALNTGKLTKNTYFFVREDKTRFQIAITATPVKLNKEIVGLIEVIQDVTKEKEIDKAKSEFISLASHQLKTPPTIVKLLTERLLGDKIGKLTKKQEEYVNDIRSSNQRMIDLVNALLNVSRIELGSFVVQVNECDICAIVQNIIDELKTIIDRKQLKLKTVFENKSTMLMLDETLFRVIINNIITNAINYTEEGGKIQVICKIINKGEKLEKKLFEEDNFMIIISDTGYGIPQKVQDKMFTKFFRADNARAKHADGTGLGLYIVKSILDHSGGFIYFTSRENEGSTFYVTIPMTGMKAKAGKKEIIS